MERLSNCGVIRPHIQGLDGATVMTRRPEQYRQLARDFHFMAWSVPHAQNRSTLLKMAAECERLADQQERPNNLRSESLMGGDFASWE